MNPVDHEELLVRRGERSGLYTVIAVHSTVLGPALGGCRLWSYPSTADGVSDAMRLARAMTYKAAAAGLDLGGGKGVICAAPGGPPRGAERKAALLDFADSVAALDGRYITAEDVGTSADDIAVIAQRTSHVTGLPPELGGSGDPSPLTAGGVETAIRACCEHRYGSRSLHGARIAVVGLGHVGSRLAQRLAAAGAELVVSDIDPARRAVATALGADWLEPEEEMLADCDVLAPCALGGAITAENVGSLRCEIVCGSANNILAEDSLAEELAARGILYAPDFIANAGGLINVFGELHDLDRERVARLVDGIGDCLRRVIDVADQRSITPLKAAYELAEERLRQAAPSAPSAQAA
jgi:leucine dehydrogenase